MRCGRGRLFSTQPRKCRKFDHLRQPPQQPRAGRGYSPPLSPTDLDSRPSAAAAATSLSAAPAATPPFRLRRLSSDGGGDTEAPERLPMQHLHSSRCAAFCLSVSVEIRSIFKVYSILIHSLPLGFLQVCNRTRTGNPNFPTINNPAPEPDSKCNADSAQQSSRRHEEKSRRQQK